MLTSNVRMAGMSSRPDSGSSRRQFLRNAALTSGAIMSGSGAPAQQDEAVRKQPNVLMVCADQFRADFIGAMRENPSTRTPHLDALARRGVLCRNAFSNQPLCSPSRASFLTSRYATETGVWKLGLELDHNLPTIAQQFRSHGYSAAFMGKWHVSSNNAPDGSKQMGWIPAGPSRGGFDDLWEGANVLELVSHPDHGSYWDDSGKDIGFEDEYRVDFITDRAVNYIQQKHDRPWFLFVSQLEPHHQNDIDQFVPPERYKKSFENAFVPADLQTLPGNWLSHLPGYYGCVQAIDDCIGQLVGALEKTGEIENTVILFFSDHGCTFRTRMGEYKRSPHDASIRVPFIVAGPGFDHARTVEHTISLLDLAPTLLDAAGIAPAEGMRGRSLLSLLRRPEERAGLENDVFIQISASYCGRMLRTPEWCYVVYDPTVDGENTAHSTKYTEFALYSIAADPAQHVNLIARPEYKEISRQLRNELQRRLVAAGEPAAEIVPAKFYA